jgi:hypothetical protein
MNIRSLFERKPKGPSVPVVADGYAVQRRLDVDALDACVGGRTQTDGVDCYLHSEQPRDH